MKLEIIAVGTEVLMGDIVNTNASYLASHLVEMGFDVYYQSVVGDNQDRLKECLDIAFSRVDIVITTGGLGPTKDDLTKEVCASYFDKELVLDDSILMYIQDLVSKRNTSLNDGMKKQAFIPIDSIILKNDYGTAPGSIISENGKTIIILPGPPSEMKPMFENYVIPYLKNYSEYVIYSNNIKICGMGESEVEEKLGDLMENKNPTLALYVGEGEVRLRISCKEKDEYKAKEEINKIKEKVYPILKDVIYSDENKSLEEVVCKELIEKNITISVAESCTGGMLSAKLIDYPGISKVFKEGIVCYSDESKSKRLGISKDDIEKYNAVSEEIAKEMVLRCAKYLDTDIAISTTGVAGPYDLDENRKVGLVYIGFYIKGKIKVEKLNLFGDRQKIRTVTVKRALDILRKELKCV